MATIRTNSVPLDDAAVERILLDPQTQTQLQEITLAIFSRTGDIERCDDPELPNYWWWTVKVIDADADGGMRERRRRWHRAIQERFGDLAHRFCLAALPAKS